MSKNLKNITSLYFGEEEVTIDHIWYEGSDYIHLGTIGKDNKLEIGPAIPVEMLPDLIEKLQDVARFYVHDKTGEQESML